MRVLITNNTLTQRAGTELYVRDLALALRSRGHEPVAFSTLLGEVAEELSQSGVRVIDDLSLLAEKPDIIHGHHHVETMMALLHFLDVPAIYFCHGFLPWEEAPLHFPRVMRYVPGTLSAAKLVSCICILLLACAFIVLFKNWIPS